MKRVAALYLPNWSIDRLRRAEPMHAPPPERGGARAALAGLAAPRDGGWRPGARWARRDEDSARRARGDVDAEIARLPRHQRPPLRELGRRSEAAEHPFRAMPPDEGGPRTKWSGAAAPADPAIAPLVTTVRIGSRVLVAAACPAAQALGIAAGMPLASVRAGTPGLSVREGDPAGDHAALRRLALRLARRLSPIVAPDGTDGLLIDVTGVAHLHGGETRMARRLVRRLARRGVSARVAIADTAGAAHALARHRARDVLLCPPACHAEALAPLPTGGLRIEPSAIELLRRLGIDTIGQLAAMPAGPLAARFGPALVTRLDQALGRAAEPLDPVVPAQRIAIHQRFVEPIATAEAIEHWLAVLVPRLTGVLAARGLGALRIELVAARVDGVPQRLRIGLARASRDPAHLLRLLMRRIEEVEPGYGIDSLVLHVRLAEPLGPVPVVERLDHEAAPDLAPLVDTLAGRGARLWRSRPVESDVPERSVGAMPVLDSPARGAPASRIDDIAQLDRAPPLPPWHPRWPRPARLLARPEQVDHVVAELPDQPPRRFTWRGVRHRIVRADGPERIHGEWWLRAGEAHAVRDYFRVEDDAGARFWLYRRGDGLRGETGDLKWFLHGLFG